MSDISHKDQIWLEPFEVDMAIETGRLAMENLAGWARTVENELAIAQGHAFALAQELQEVKPESVALLEFERYWQDETADSEPT